MVGKYRLDKRCLTKGRVLCINKKTRKLVYVVNGKAVQVADARFGARKTPTRNGTFKVYRKSKNHVSSLYHSKMPYAMFFSGGQAVHYSSDFKARGYNGASHGCVNIRDKNEDRLDLRPHQGRRQGRRLQRLISSAAAAAGESLPGRCRVPGTPCRAAVPPGRRSPRSTAVVVRRSVCTAMSAADRAGQP